MPTKPIYAFARGHAEGTLSMSPLLGRSPSTINTASPINSDESTDETFVVRSTAVCFDIQIL